MAGLAAEYVVAQVVRSLPAIRVQVVCTGKEERLLDCDFPENFGIDYEYAMPTDEEHTVNLPAGARPAPGPATSESAAARAAGIGGRGCNDQDRLAVVCRLFEITGA